jgi:arylsulfatase A-like enzyme
MNHLSDHPYDLTIPVVLSGRHIARSTLGIASLLDIPPTILWALGMTVPGNYEGRILGEAFDDVKSRSTVLA